MKLEDAIKSHGRLSPFVLPEFAHLVAAVRRVHQRWPDVEIDPEYRDREALALRLKALVIENHWSDVRIGFMRAAALAVFDHDRGDRSDLDAARSFLIAETSQSEQRSFLSGMVAVYFETYRPSHRNSVELANALNSARERMGLPHRVLFAEFPEFLDGRNGFSVLAHRLFREVLTLKTKFNPYQKLTEAGLRNPHGVGFMEHVHRSMTDLVRRNLNDPDMIEWFLRWMKPAGRRPIQTGAAIAVDALLSPWIHQEAPDYVREILVEKLIGMYRDPRIHSGGIWAAVSNECMRVMHRMLTREDMRFFTGVVDSAQKDPMWLKRREFWLKLYDDRVIDAAWVAFSYSAADYARKHLMSESASDIKIRFGRQIAAGSRTNTSLLILEIGDKIFVEGCHNYKTHMFHKGDPKAPKLFQEEYDCEDIRRISHNSLAHNSIPHWSKWVMDMINADISYKHEYDDDRHEWP